MATPLGWLTFSSRALLPSCSRVEKPQSPSARAIPDWGQKYQRRIEEAKREFILLKEQEEPKEAQSGQGKLEMREADTSLVHREFSVLTRQVAHVMQACNEKRGFRKQGLINSKTG